MTKTTVPTTHSSLVTRINFQKKKNCDDYVCADVCVCMYGYVYVYAYICMYMYIYVYVYAYVYVYTNV